MIFIMKEKTKLKIKSGIFSGLLFAMLMAGFDFYNEENFSVLKFMIHFAFFGGVMGIMAKEKVKKEAN